MPATLEQAETKPIVTRSTFLFRFISTIVLWSVALVIAFSGYEFAFYALICAFGLIALWEFYRMLDHRGLPNFKITAMICGAVMLGGSFYYFAKMGPARSYDFEVAVLVFFLLTVFARQMFARLRDDEPLPARVETEHPNRRAHLGGEIRCRHLEERMRNGVARVRLGRDLARERRDLVFRERLAVEDLLHLLDRPQLVEAHARVEE